VTACIACLTAPAAAPSEPAPAGDELLTNGSFDNWEGGRPNGWSVVISATEGEGAESSIEPGGDRKKGAHSLAMSGDASTQRWYTALQSVEVKPGEIFRFSGYLRSADVSRDGHRYSNSQAAVIAESQNGQRINMWILGPAVGTTEWTLYEKYMQTPPGCALFKVYVFLSMSGTLECDDLSLVRLRLPKPDPDAPREERWRGDIEFLSEYLPKLHAKPFTAVDRRCAEIAGGRVTRIGGVGLTECLDAVRPLIACETESWFLYQAPQMLALADVLYGRGLADSPGRVEVAVTAEDGTGKSCVVELPDSGDAVQFETREPAAENRPLYLSSSSNYSYHYLEHARTLYLQYLRCREDPQLPMAEFTREVAAFMDSRPIDKFVLDVRHNTGGGSELLNGLIEEVAARKSAGRIGRCYVITDRATFSAAALNTLDFRRATGAVVVGEPMGNKPNRFGQLNYFTLPNSGLRVQYATKRFVRVEGDPPILAPDIPVETTWDDYMAGRDPALARILADD
jgi:hypothetical protein